MPYNIILAQLAKVQDLLKPQLQHIQDTITIHITKDTQNKRQFRFPEYPADTHSD